MAVFRSKVVKKSRHCPQIIYFHHHPGYWRKVLKRGADQLSKQFFLWQICDCLLGPTVQGNERGADFICYRNSFVMADLWLPSRSNSPRWWRKVQILSAITTILWWQICDCLPGPTVQVNEERWRFYLLSKQFCYGRSVTAIPVQQSKISKRGEDLTFIKTV